MSSILPCFIFTLGISGEQKNESVPDPDVVFNLDSSHSDDEVLVSLKPITKLAIQDTNQNRTIETDRELDLVDLSHTVTSPGLVPDRETDSPSEEVENILEHDERLRSVSSFSGELPVMVKSCDNVETVLQETDIDQILQSGNFIRQERRERTSSESSEQKAVLDVVTVDDGEVMCNSDHSPLGMKEENRNCIEGAGYGVIETDNPSGSSGASSNQESSEGDSGDRQDQKRERRDSGVGSSLTRVPRWVFQQLYENKFLWQFSRTSSETCTYMLHEKADIC